MRRMGVLREAGQHELAWRDAYQAVRGIGHVVTAQSRHIVLGEAAMSALALKYPAIALHYQNAAIRMLQLELVALPPDQMKAIEGMKVNLGTAFRARAQIYLSLDQHETDRC